LKSLKHLPTKPTFVHSITKTPYIRQQHYNPNKDKFHLKNYIKDEEYLNFLKKHIFLDDNINTIKDLEKYLNENYKIYPEIFVEYENLSHYLPLLFYLKEKGIKMSIVDEIIAYMNYGHNGFIFNEIFGKNKIFDIMKNLYLLDNINYEKTFWKIMKYFDYEESLKIAINTNEIINNILANYVQISPQSIENINFFFQKLIKQKMKPENFLEEILLKIYKTTQEILKEISLPKKFYRGMRFIIPKHKKEIKLKSPRLSPTSLDESVSMNFIPTIDIKTKVLYSRKKLKEKYGIDLILPKTFEQNIDLKREMITIDDKGDGYLIGYLIEFKPKFKEQVFAVLHDEYIKDFSNKIGMQYKPGIWFHQEKEWIIFM